MRDFLVSAEQHNQRNKWQKEAAETFLKDVANQKIEDYYFSNGVMVNIQPIVRADSDERFKVTKFGVVNTIEKAACGAFVGQCLLGFKGYKIDVISLANICAQKGYRSWYFEKHPDIRFFTASLDAMDVKQRFKDIPNITYCNTQEDFEQLLGKVVGKGGSIFFIDNLITDFYPREDFVPVRDTRIRTVDGIFSNLRNGFPVPVRVENKIYLDDESKSEGHYIIIVGYEKDEFIIYDSNYGVIRKKIKRVIEAIKFNKNLIAVWDVSKM